MNKKAETVEWTWTWDPHRWRWQEYESYGGHLLMVWRGPLLRSWTRLQPETLEFVEERYICGYCKRDLSGLGLDAHSSADCPGPPSDKQ